MGRVYFPMANHCNPVRDHLDKFSRVVYKFSWEDQSTYSTSKLALADELGCGRERFSLCLWWWNMQNLIRSKGPNVSSWHKLMWFPPNFSKLGFTLLRLIIHDRVRKRCTVDEKCVRCNGECEPRSHLYFVGQFFWGSLDDGYSIKGDGKCWDLWLTISSLVRHQI